MSQAPIVEPPSEDVVPRTAEIESPATPPERPDLAGQRPPVGTGRPAVPPTALTPAVEPEPVARAAEPLVEPPAAAGQPPSEAPQPGTSPVELPRTVLPPVPRTDRPPVAPPTRVEPTPTARVEPAPAPPRGPAEPPRPPDKGGRSISPILIGGGIGVLILLAVVAGLVFLLPRDRTPATAVDPPASTAAAATPTTAAPGTGKAVGVEKSVPPPTVAPTTVPATPTVPAKAATTGPAAKATNVAAKTGSPAAKTGAPKVAPTPVPPARLTVAAVAGAGNPGSADGPGASAQFTSPSGIATGPDGSIYVADTGSNRIRRIAADGTVTTVAGSGQGGLIDGTGAAVQFNGPAGVVSDGAGTLYVADTLNHRIRRIAPDGVVTTIAGSGTIGLGGGGFRDGSQTEALFRNPTAISRDDAGNLYVADKGNHRIRKIAPDGTVSTVAGGATPAGGFRDGPADTAEFSSPGGIASDASGNLYVADTFNHRIRKIAGGTVSTLAGAGEPGKVEGQGPVARFDFPEEIALGPGDTLYVADSSNHRIRKVTLDGTVTTVAGDTEGSADGPGDQARFSFPKGIDAGADGALYVADTNNHRIRRLTAP